jgi:hypothetical protein
LEEALDLSSDRILNDDFMYKVEQAVGMNYDIFVSFISRILLSTRATSVQTKNRCCVICEVAKLWVGTLGFDSLQGKTCFRHLQKCPNRPSGRHSHLFSGYWGVFPGTLITTSIDR